VADELVNIYESIRALINLSGDEFRAGVEVLDDLIDLEISEGRAGSAADLLADLRYDLSYFEPNERLRRDSPNYFGLSHAKELLTFTLHALEELNANPDILGHST
jgi:hypothetical protein